MRAPCCIKCCVMDYAQSTFRYCSCPLLKYGFRCRCKHSEFLGSARHTSTSQKLYHALLSLRSSSPRLGRPSLGKLATVLLCSAKIPYAFAISSGKYGKESLIKSLIENSIKSLVNSWPKAQGSGLAQGSGSMAQDSEHKTLGTRFLGIRHKTLGTRHRAQGVRIKAYSTWHKE